MFLFFFSCSGDHRDLHSFPTRRSSDLVKNDKPTISMSLSHCIHQTLNSKASTRFHSGGLHYEIRSEERFSRNAETDLVCRLLLEKKNLGVRRLVCCELTGWCLTALWSACCVCPSGRTGRLG